MCVLSTWLRKGRRKTQGFMARLLSTLAHNLHMKSTLSPPSFIFSSHATMFLLPKVAQTMDSFVLNVSLISRGCINRIELPIKLHNSVVYRLATLDFKEDCDLYEPLCIYNTYQYICWL